MRRFLSLNDAIRRGGWLWLSSSELCVGSSPGRSIPGSGKSADVYSFELGLTAGAHREPRFTAEQAPPESAAVRAEALACASAPSRLVFGRRLRQAKPA